MLPERAIWSISGALQHAASTTSAATPHGHTRGRGRPRAERTHQVAKPPSPTASATTVGGMKPASHCSSKLPSSTVAGASRYSPQASDQHTKMSASRGNRPADGFQLS